MSKTNEKTNRKSELAFSRENFVNIPRNDEGEILNKISSYCQRAGNQRYLLSVHGFPGTGKSYLMRQICHEIRTNSKYKSVCISYADISDCADEVDVYYKIARELQDFYIHHPHQKNKAVEQLITIYEWVYGVNKRYAVEHSKDNGSDMADAITEIVTETCNYLIEQDDTQDTISTALEVVDKLAGAIPFAKALIAIPQIVVKTSQENRARALLQEIVEAFSSKMVREEILRNLLVGAIKGDKAAEQQLLKPVIILDNFQLVANNDLGRDQTWLSQPGKLMDSFDAMWIIVSRQNVISQFKDIIRTNGMLEVYELQGFNEEEARLYFMECCPCPDSKDETYNTIIEKMVEAGRISTHKKGQYTYLPYLLRLIVLHYRALERDPSHTIVPEDFVALEKREDIFGYYFYKDLTDLMINAFQILSCIDEWDALWIDLVRERFDNHLLNAWNLLSNTAPIEELENGKFKLHEAVKEGLYNGSRNYIKLDVLKYLFEKFNMIYGGKETVEHKEIWYESTRLQTFVKLAYAYTEADNKKSMESLKNTMAVIYAQNKERGSFSDDFIRLYSEYIDKVREEKEIPFVKTSQIDLSALDNLKNQIGENIDQWEYSVQPFPYICDYMQYCFNLGDLYTNNSQNDEAEQLEKLCLYFWEKMLEKIKREYSDSAEYFQCQQKIVKARNAIAYDLSANHSYSSARDYGEDGMNNLKELAVQLLDRLVQESKISEGEREIYEIIVFPEESPEFTVNSCTEIHRELFTKLIQAYQKLMESEIQSDKYGKILKQLLLTDQQNLRGNYPWYCIKAPKETDNADEIWKYGARTYWLRKARRQAAVNIKANDRTIEDYTIKMQESYHNICAYLFKLGKVETACILEKEVMEQSSKLLPRTSLSAPAESRIRKTEAVSRDSTEKGGLEVYLWKREELSLETVSEFFGLNGKLYEQMQYMGDYYLHMGFYEIAVKQFCSVMLYRMLVQGEDDSKTLDTLIRMLVAVYANDDTECLAQVKDYVKGRLEGSLQVNLNARSKGVKEKWECLQKVFEISEEMQANREQDIEEMLRVIDSL
ncbi:MAG: hypothetical protein NC417_08000 [Candidatus Gastranaerophilales bacterium]|nr:hypothetical protein [Candidatus Gastranaerophilales bacterium]